MLTIEYFMNLRAGIQGLYIVQACIWWLAYSKSIIWRLAYKVGVQYKQVSEGWHIRLAYSISTLDYLLSFCYVLNWICLYWYVKVHVISAFRHRHRQVWGGWPKLSGSNKIIYTSNKWDWSFTVYYHYYTGRHNTHQ